MSSTSLDARGAVAAALARSIAAFDELPPRLAEIAGALPGRLAFSTSLGLEDQAVLHAIAESKAEIDVFSLDTGRHFPETLDTIEESERRFGLKIRVVSPDAADLETLVTRDGINGFRLSIEARKACCDVRKVRPLRRALAGASGWITGLRRGQYAGRNEVPFAGVDAAFGLVKVNPLADWTLAKLEAYVAANDIPVNPLHARGLTTEGAGSCSMVGLLASETDQLALPSI